MSVCIMNLCVRVRVCNDLLCSLYFYVVNQMHKLIYHNLFAEQYNQAGLCLAYYLYTYVVYIIIINEFK